MPRTNGDTSRKHRDASFAACAGSRRGSCVNRLRALLHTRADP
ncbi:Hypothetical protein A7982_10617 [Minicystis rosea]|nr:Hypothetical protein A7982_10617 [Minicystis rosea]